MAQNPAHNLSRCPKCHAGRGHPCVRRDGAVAQRTHYGRPHWSGRVGVPRSERAFFQDIIAEAEARRYPN